jgi:hypothetical protein
MRDQRAAGSTLGETRRAVRENPACVGFRMKVARLVRDSMDPKPRRTVHGVNEHETTRGQPCSLVNN